MSRRTLRLATRGSDLALRQAASVREALKDRRYEVELVEVETEGDRITDELIHRLGKTGAFVRALDERILAGEVDAAVHSMKDMPTDAPDELVVAAVLERGPANDVLVTPDGVDLDELPEGATVGTSSLRRRAQLLDARPDLTVEPLRGNVDTRVEKLLAPSLQAEHEARVEADEDRKGHIGEDDYEPAYDRRPEEWFDSLTELERNALGREPDVEYDGIVLAEAGLRRSGLDHHVEFSRLPTKTFVPAPGQGAIAVTATARAEELNEQLDFPRTRVETTVERTLLAELGGGCIAPIGVYAVLQGSYVHVRAQVFGPDGELVEGSRDLPVEKHATAAADFAAALRERGAADLIQRAAEANE
ncbi:hydroxymethylbilane synthase [Salinigranum salinum]|uniref:hydroxymethylbilane synthase n=1 Tax=Salinigranum salinum TaxID=1364937 RepID=UPI0012610400|nr:hydroxymethylbilane synthase [Salinigranum salinum]